MTSTCVLRGGLDAHCPLLGTCGLRERAHNSVFTTAASYGIEQCRAVRSVGALIEKDLPVKATAFHIGANWVLSAGHVFGDGPTMQHPNNREESASQLLLVQSFEATGDTRLRQTFALDTTQPVGRKMRRRAQRGGQGVRCDLDYAICKVATNVQEVDLAALYPPAPIATSRPDVGDTLYVIHHDHTECAKQITECRCVAVGHFKLTVDPILKDLFESGSSGGLVVNSQWQTVAILTDSDGVCQLLGPVLADIETFAPEITGSPEAVALIRLNQGSPVCEEEPIKAKNPEAPDFPKSRFVDPLPKPVENAFPTVGYAYVVNVEPGRFRTGTVFTVGNNWILTAHHVARSPEDTAGLGFDFCYTRDDHVVRKQYAPDIGAHPWYFCSDDGLYSCDAARYHLDYALIKIRAVGENELPLKIAPITGATPSKGNEIYIVGHADVPGRRHKGVLAFKSSWTKLIKNTFAFVDNELAFYDVARAEGLSGAPVLDASGFAFAMHTHKKIDDDDTPAKKHHSWGVRIPAVARDLLRQHPNLRDEVPDLQNLLTLTSL